MRPVRRPVIGVMGAGEGASRHDCWLAEELGAAIARRGWVLLSGARPCGAMAAACQGAMAIDGHLVVGVLPDDGVEPSRRQATAAVDVALFTGMGQARNVINVLSSDVVVVCGAGGPGTLSEAAHALKAGRPLVLLAAPDPWQALCFGQGGAVRSCGTVAEAIQAIALLLPAAGGVGDQPAAHRARPDQRLPVALVQLCAGDDAAANRRHAEAWLQRALQDAPGGQRPRLLMLPEIWNAPYDAARFGAYAEPIPDLSSALEPDPLQTSNAGLDLAPALDPVAADPDSGGPDLSDGPSPSLAMVARLAKRHGVSVIAGSIPERGADGRLYNTATVIDARGRLRAKYRKLHLFDVDVPGGIRFRESDSLSGGSQLSVLDGAADPLGTGLAQPPNLGLLICYDIRFPEQALLLQQRHGCTFLACPAAFNTTTGPRHWHLLMRARALDTQCFLLACSSARPEAADRYPSYGHSLVVDPWGAVIAEAGIAEQVLYAELDWAAVAQARQAIPTGCQRRSDVYRLGSA